METLQHEEHTKATSPFGTLTNNSDYPIIVKWLEGDSEITNRIHSNKGLPLGGNPIDIITKNKKPIKINLNGHGIDYIEWYPNEGEIDGEVASRMRIYATDHEYKGKSVGGSTIKTHIDPAVKHPEDDSGP